MRRNGVSDSRCVTTGVPSSRRISNISRLPVMPICSVNGPPVGAFRREQVLLDQVVDRDRALMLDVGAGTPDRFLIERHRDDAVLRILVSWRLGHVQIEPQSDRARMGIEAFGLAQRHRRRPQRAQLVRPAFQDRGALHEVEHAEPGGEPRRTRRRQHVVGAADIVADRLRRVRRRGRSRRHCGSARQALPGSAVMISRCSAAIAFASGTASLELLHQDDRAEIVPRGARDLRARQRRQLRLAPRVRPRRQARRCR